MTKTKKKIFNHNYKKKIKTKKNEDEHVHEHEHEHDTKKIDLNKIIKKIEFDMLLMVITDQILFLIYNKVPKDKIKQKIISLLKELSIKNNLIKNNIKDKEFIIIFNCLYKNTLILNKKILSKIKNTSKSTKSTKSNKYNKSNTKFTNYKLKNASINQTKGGFYFRNIEDKGDAPVTGNDMVKLLDEMQQFFYNAQWTDEGAFLRDPNTLISMLRGDTEAFKSYLTWRIIPQYIQMYPPFIKWDAIKAAIDKKKYEDLPDYLLAYQSYRHLEDEYMIDKGLKSPDALNKELYVGFYDKLFNALDQNILKFQRYRSMLQGRFPLQLPI